MCPEEPEIEEYEAKDTKDLIEHMEAIARNDTNITALPLTKLMIALGLIEKCETSTVE